MTSRSFIPSFSEIHKRGGDKWAERLKSFSNPTYPEDEIEALAKCFLPDILDFFESQDGSQEFEEWKREQSEKDT